MEPEDAHHEREAVPQVVTVVRAKAEDCEAICSVHRASITILAGGHYTRQEIDTWVSGLSPDNYHAAMRDDIFLVARFPDRIVGFVHFAPKDDLIVDLWVDPRQARAGIGSKLLLCAEHEARTLGKGELRITASLNAVPFYLNRGYAFEAETSRMAGSDVMIACVFLRKGLA